MSISSFLTAIALSLIPVQLLAASAQVMVVQTPSAIGSVPQGAQRVAFLQLEISASCAAPATVREITLLHEGLGSMSNIERVYLTDGRRRLTRGRTIDESDSTVRLKFIPVLKLAACASRTLFVAADFASDAAPSGEHRMSIELHTDVLADGAFVTITGKKEAAPAVVRPKSVGAVTVTFLNLTSPLRYGGNRTLARFRLEADGQTDQEIHSILLTNDGKAIDEDLQNLRLQNRKGIVLTDIAAAMEGNAVRLMFNPPLRLDRNDEILLDVKGDIRASNRRTVRFGVEEPSDLEALPAAR